MARARTTKTVAVEPPAEGMLAIEPGPPAEGGPDYSTPVVHDTTDYSQPRVKGPHELDLSVGADCVTCGRRAIGTVGGSGASRASLCRKCWPKNVEAPRP